VCLLLKLISLWLIHRPVFAGAICTTRVHFKKYKD